MYKTKITFHAEGGEYNLVSLTAHKKKLFGFTLVELLIVIAILGILAAAVLVAINPAKRTRQARDAQRKNDIGSLATELQAYYTTPGQGVYPASGSALCGTSASGLTTLTSSGGLKQVPDDPSAGRDYCYTTEQVAPANEESAVWATLEDPTSSGATTSSHIWCWASTSNAVVERATSAGCTP